MKNSINRTWKFIIYAVFGILALVILHNLPEVENTSKSSMIICTNYGDFIMCQEM